MNIKYKALLAYLAVCFFWGSTYLAIRIGVEVFPPFMLASIRFLIAGALVIIYAKWKKHEFPKSYKSILKVSLVGVLLLAGGNGLVVMAEQWVPSGIASLIIACVPLFIAIIEIFILRMKKMNPTGFIGLILGFGGVAYLALSDGVSGSVNTLGIALLLAASLFWSIGSVYSKTFDTESSIIGNIGIQMFAGGVALFLIGSIRGEISQINWSIEGILVIAYLIIFGSIVGYSSYIYVLQQWPASRVGTYAYVNPVVAIFLGFIVLREPITITILISMFVILCGVIMVQRAKIEDC